MQDGIHPWKSQMKTYLFLIKIVFHLFIASEMIVMYIFNFQTTHTYGELVVEEL